MIRVALYLVIVGLIALGIAWIADRPGEVAVTWLGLRIETTVMVALSALIVVVAAGIFLWSLLSGLWRAPRQFAEFWRRRRSEQGHRAITKGLLAIGAGDSGQARKYADEAKRLASGEPLTLLLAAQAAQMSGDQAAAERMFRQMTESTDTRLLGLRGLYVEAQRRDDAASARLYAEEAARRDPSLSWAGHAVLQFRCAAGDWSGALEIVERNRRSGAVDKEVYYRQRAVLLTAQAIASEEADRDAAKSAALEAARLAPDLVPAVVLAARFLSEAGDIRKAARMIEKAWLAMPHPDLADAYIHVRIGDSARERLARARRLNEKGAGGVEGAIALARAAIDAREFVQARQTLLPYLDQPTQRIALLMAQLEQAEFGDEGRAREWTTRALHAARDPAWTADGIVSERWMPVSPVSGRLDAFEWKVPLTAIGYEGPAVDLEQETPPLAQEKTAAAADAAPISPEPAPPPSAPATRRVPPPRPAPAEEIVPLVHVPDDPGPDLEPEREPVPERSGTGAGWRRFLSW